MKTASYAKTRFLMQPGDLIAFGGKGRLSEVIKWATRSVVSHVGVVLETKVAYGDNIAPERIVDVMESTTLYEDPTTKVRTAGVQRNRLSRRIEYHDGEVWFLPLSHTARERLHLDRLVSFLLNNDRKPYDMKQAVKSGLDFLDKLGPTYAEEDYSEFFCSELIAAAYEQAGVIYNVNASEVTPADLCAFDIYDPVYYQLKGEKKTIKGANSLRPNGFGL